jgi:hypothetical protein
VTEGSLVTDKLTSLLGQISPPAVLQVEAGAIARYADAIDDPNPLYRNVEYAKILAGRPKGVDWKQVQLWARY